MLVHDNRAGLADVSLACSARGCPPTESRTSNDKKSNPNAKLLAGPISGKLSDFKAAGDSDRPYCLAVVTKGWQVLQILAAHLTVDNAA